MSDDAIYSTPTPDPAWLAGRDGQAWRDAQRDALPLHPGPSHTDEHHHHYQRLRDEHARQMDEDYLAWRRHRFAGDFDTWRGEQQEPLAPRHEGALDSLGRAVGETVIGTEEPALDATSRH